MKILSLPLLLACSAAFAAPPAFEEPFEVTVDGEPLKTEAPGYASPTLVDLDGDGLKDLVVGQFRDGAMLFLKNTGKTGAPKFKTKEWIQTGAEKAVVPGVW